MQDENIQISVIQDDATTQEETQNEIAIQEAQEGIVIEETQERVAIQEISEDAEATEIVKDIGYAETEIDAETAISHQDLIDTALVDLHPITSITGLSNKLKELEQLKQVLSTGRDFAQYYVWSDGNPLKEDRTGYFVTLVDNTDCIRICNDANDDVIGVVVSPDDVGFVGGHSDDVVTNNHKYGLVCLIGHAMVRRVRSVNTGDYVVPNTLGIAQTSSFDVKIPTPYFETITITNETTYRLSHLPTSLNGVYLLLEDGTLGEKVTIGTIVVDKIISINDTLVELTVGDGGFNEGDQLFFMYTYETSKKLGYKVTAVSYEAGVYYARISIVPNGNALARIEEEINILTDRLVANEGNVTVAINRANDAYALAELGGGSGNAEVIDRLNKVEDKVQQAQDASNSAVDTANSAATHVEEIAKQVESDVEEMTNEVKEEIEKNREELAATNEQIINITKITDPIDKWTNTDGSVGVEYLLQYIDDDLATKAEVQGVDGKVESAYTAIEQNAKEIRLIASSVQKYCIGEYSQAYGLTVDEAKSILPVGIVYAPGNNHTEQYSTDSGNIIQTFRRGFSYVWNGTSWEESNIENVNFSDVYIYPPVGSSVSYWYTGDATPIYNDVAYEKYTLYEGSQGQWVPVATLQDSSVSRIASALRIEDNSIKAEIADVRGNYVKIEERISDAEAEIENIANWENDETSALSVLKQRVDDAEADITQLAEFTYTTALDAKIFYTQPSGGRYYATRPEWDEDKKKWVFSGNSFDIATNEYCYAPNPNNAQTYFQYTCDKDNQWYEIEKGISTSLATIQQQADANGASIGMIVKNGEVDGAAIIAAVNDNESTVKIEGNQINLKGQVTFESFDQATQDRIDADTIDVQIWSNRGNVFKSRNVFTTLSCHVFKGGVDITNTLSDDKFKWIKYKDDGTQAEDLQWSGKTLTISPGDVYNRAVFQCAVEI